MGFHKRYSYSARLIDFFRLPPEICSLRLGVLQFLFHSGIVIRALNPKCF